MKIGKLVCCLALVFAASACFAQANDGPEAGNEAKRSHRKFFVINAPSIGSEGPDSIVTLDSHGNGTVFFSAKHKFSGLDDVACRPKNAPPYFVSQNVFQEDFSRLLRFNASGKIVHRTPFGSSNGGPIALAFDKAGNFYAGQEDVIFKNAALFATLPDATEMGKIAIDSKGNLYITKPTSSLLFRVDSHGDATQFADSSEGLNGPYGVAVSRMGDIFVANNPPSAPAVILKFDQSGSPSPFATTTEIQPNIRSMTFDRNGNLYATLWESSTILKFDVNGKASVFANASSGVDRPDAIWFCPVP